MPCLVALIALSFPRFAIILTVLFSDYIGKATGGQLLWPILGFLFMPLTLLAYCFAINSHGSVDGIYLVLVIIAALIDLGMLGGGAHSSRKKVVVVRRD